MKPMGSNDIEFNPTDLILRDARIEIGCCRFRHQWMPKSGRPDFGARSSGRGRSGAAWVRRRVFVFTDHHGIVPFSQRVNVRVGPSRPSSATRTASRAPCSTVSVPAYPLRFVLVKPGETALTLIPSGSSSSAMATVKALRAVLDAG